MYREGLETGVSISRVMYCLEVVSIVSVQPPPFLYISLKERLGIQCGVTFFYCLPWWDLGCSLFCHR